MKDEFITYYSQEEGAQHATKGHMRKHKGWSKGRGSQGRAWAGDFVSQERMDEAGMQV